ncbi:Rho GTPase-activating protein 39 [Balamuthia mandrillaris]
MADLLSLLQSKSEELEQPPQNNNAGSANHNHHHHHQKEEEGEDVYDLLPPPPPSFLPPSSNDEFHHNFKDGYSLPPPPDFSSGGEEANEESGEEEKPTKEEPALYSVTSSLLCEEYVDPLNNNRPKSLDCFSSSAPPPLPASPPHGLRRSSAYTPSIAPPPLPSSPPHGLRRSSAYTPSSSSLFERTAPINASNNSNNSDFGKQETQDPLLSSASYPTGISSSTPNLKTHISSSPPSHAFASASALPTPATTNLAGRSSSAPHQLEHPQQENNNTSMAVAIAALQPRSASCMAGGRVPATPKSVSFYSPPASSKINTGANELGHQQTVTATATATTTTTAAIAGYGLEEEEELLDLASSSTTGGAEGEESATGSGKWIAINRGGAQPGKKGGSVFKRMMRRTPKKESRDKSSTVEIGNLRQETKRATESAVAPLDDPTKKKDKKGKKDKEKRKRRDSKKASLDAPPPPPITNIYNNNRLGNSSAEGYNNNNDSQQMLEEELVEIPKDVKVDINKFQLKGYAKKYFAAQKKRRYIFKRQVPLKEMLAFQDKKLLQPLLSSHKEGSSNKALLLFETILEYQGVIKKGTHEMQHEARLAREIVSEGISHGELRDEIFCQLCKQTTNTPNLEYAYKGWELLCFCCISFAPTKNFEEWLRKHLEEYLKYNNKTNTKEPQYASYCLRKLDRICKAPPSARIPSLKELEILRLAPFGHRPFGSTLEEIMQAQREQFPSASVPVLLPRLCDAILQNGGCQQLGLFRVKGSGKDFSQVMSEKKAELEAGNYDCLEDLGENNNCNLPAELLKLWLRELADPPIPISYYEQGIKASSNPKKVVELVHKLPKENQATLAFLIRFLQHITKPDIAAVTQMGVDNVSSIFAPSFLRNPSDDPQLILLNTKAEAEFMKNLLLHLQPEEILHEN